MNEEQKAGLKRVMEFSKRNGFPTSVDFFGGLIVGSASIILEEKGLPLECYDFAGAISETIPVMLLIRDELLAEDTP